MRKILVVGLLAGTFALGAGAQSAKDAEKALRDNLVKKQFFLRGFSADTTVNWKWDGKDLVASPPAFYTLGAVTVKTVKVNGEHVLIQGDRQILVRTGAASVQFSSESVPVTVDVDLHGANMAEVLPTLQAGVFYSDMQSAIRQIPTTYLELIPTGPIKKAEELKTECTCSHPASCMESVPMLAMEGMKPPAVKGSTPLPPPITATDTPAVSVVALIDDTGKVDKIWLGRPLNPTVDQTVLDAAKAYSFAPATCHDRPVSAAIRVDVPVVAPAGRGRR